MKHIMKNIDQSLQCIENFNYSSYVKLNLSPVMFKHWSQTNMDLIKAPEAALTVLTELVSSWST